MATLFSFTNPTLTFFGIPLDRSMSYKDGREISYATHVQHLFDKARECGQILCNEETIRCLIWSDACVLSSGKTRTSFIPLLREWAIEVIKDAEQGRRDDGSGFHSNLIFDWGSALDALRNPSPMDIVLRYVVAGMNGRRCCNGDKPGPAFVPTTRTVEVHAIMAGIPEHYVSPKANVFLQKYKPLLEFSPHVEQFNKMVRAAGVDITFEKQLNEETGANAYDIITARGDYVAEQLAGTKPVLTTETLDGLANALANIDLVMGDDRRDGFAASVAKWNLSEYLSRVVCARPADYKCFNTPFANEIVGRSMYGNFPGAEVNVDVQSTPLSMLYFLE